MVLMKNFINTIFLKLKKFKKGERNRRILEEKKELDRGLLEIEWWQPYDMIEPVKMLKKRH